MKKISIVLFCLSVFYSYAQILPSPTSIVYGDGEFQLKSNTKISVIGNTGKKTSEYLAEQLGTATGFQFKIKEGSLKKGIVFSEVGQDSNLGEEGYKLDISEDLIQIKAESEKGMFYAVQSLLQLFPEEIFLNSVQQHVDWKVACQQIEDTPKYSYRSFMLDSGRQYQSPEFIKRYINYLSLLKFNKFHWHLTEGQGWRIEIKKYPKLTEIGSQVAKGKEQQGFYTQEEIKDIVKYAATRHITVIPEIDVPGHSEAALTAYPEYTCFKKVPESVMAFSSHIFCAGNEDVYSFLQDVLDEVCELFPSKYIHLGGDEAPKKDWNVCPACQRKIKEENLKNSHDLQLYFSNRLAMYLKTKGKTTIFWGDVVHNTWEGNSEIHDEGVELPEDVIFDWWNYRRHKDVTLKKAIKKKHRVIANTNYYTYLNFPTTPWTNYAKNRTFDLKTIYDNNPSDLDNPDALVIGMSTSLWTDWYVQEHMIDRRVFPRIYALAEQMWSTGERKSFNDFYSDIRSKYKLLEILGIDYGPAMTSETPKDYKWD